VPGRHPDNLRAVLTARKATVRRIYPLPSSGVTLNDLVKPETGVSIESISLDEEALKWERPELQRISEHVATSEEALEAASAMETDCDRSQNINAERMRAADADLSAVRLECQQEACDNPTPDISALTARVKTRSDVSAFLAGVQELIVEIVRPKLSIATLKAFADVKGWQFKQYSLAARVCQRQLNIAMRPAVAGGDILAEPISSGVLELENGARQAEYALQAARESLRNAESALSKLTAARTSYEHVRRPIYN
jgi:hypothetical protein